MFRNIVKHLLVGYVDGGHGRTGLLTRLRENLWPSTVRTCLDPIGNSQATRCTKLVPSSIRILENHPLVLSSASFVHESFHLRSHGTFEVAYRIRERRCCTREPAELTFVPASVVPEWITAAWASAGGLQYSHSVRYSLGMYTPLSSCKL